MKGCAAHPPAGIVLYPVLIANAGVCNSMPVGEKWRQGERGGCPVAKNCHKTFHRVSASSGTGWLSRFAKTAIRMHLVFMGLGEIRSFPFLAHEVSLGVMTRLDLNGEYLRCIWWKLALVLVLDFAVCCEYFALWCHFVSILWRWLMFLSMFRGKNTLCTQQGETPKPYCQACFSIKKRITA